MNNIYLDNPVGIGFFFISRHGHMYYAYLIENKNWYVQFMSTVAENYVYSTENTGFYSQRK